MTGLRVVPDGGLPRHRMADRPRELGYWTPPEALEHSIDAAVVASPPALLVGIRAHLRELGSEDGPDERALFARVLEHFADRAPAALARIEAAVDAGDHAGAVGPARRLARQADALGAVPLARLSAVVASRAAGGQPVVPAATRAALRRELAVTCRVLLALATEILRGDAVPPLAWPLPRRDAGA